MVGMLYALILRSTVAVCTREALKTNELILNVKRYHVVLGTSLHDRRFFELSTARVGEELGSMLGVVGDGGEVGGALGVKLGAALIARFDVDGDGEVDVEEWFNQMSD